MIAWALEALLTATLLMLLVLAVRKPVSELVGAEWTYALWLLPLLLPLLPPVPAFAPIVAPELTVILPAVSATAAAAAETSGGGAGEWLLWLLALWAGGAVAFAMWQQSTYSAFMLHLGAEGRRAQPPSYGGIDVVMSEAVEGPVAVGILKRRIVVPLDFATRYSPAEQRLALEHELTHHKRLDLVWNWTALAMLTLNWFNPIAHFAFRAFRADQELACDAAVTRRAPAERHDYARALVKAASHPGLIAVCPLNHAGFLKRRLKMMKRHRCSRARTAGGLATIAMVAGAGLAVSAPGLAREEAATARIVANTPGPQAVIAAADMSTLREKCGGGAGAIVCSRAEAKDPEVRAIVAKAVAKVEKRAHEAAAEQAKRAVRSASLAEALAEASAKVSPEESAEIALFSAAAQKGREEALAHLERRNHARDALLRARERMAQIRVKGEHHHLVRVARVAQPAPRVFTVRVVDQPNVEVEALIAQARRDMEKGELARELRHISFEIKQELKALSHVH